MELRGNMGLSRTTASRIAETLRPFSIVEIRPIALRTYLSLLTVSTQLRQHGVEGRVPAAVGEANAGDIERLGPFWGLGVGYHEQELRLGINEAADQPGAAHAIDAAEDAGVALSINLTGGVFVNQSAAFSDFHGTGANPAANAALTDAAYVANRFRVVQHRLHV